MLSPLVAHCWSVNSASACRARRVAARNVNSNDSMAANERFTVEQREIIAELCVLRIAKSRVKLDSMAATDNRVAGGIREKVALALGAIRTQYDWAPLLRAKRTLAISTVGLAKGLRASCEVVDVAKKSGLLTLIRGSADAVGELLGDGAASALEKSAYAATAMTVVNTMKPDKLAIAVAALCASSITSTANGDGTAPATAAAEKNALLVTIARIVVAAFDSTVLYKDGDADRTVSTVDEVASEAIRQCSLVPDEAAASRVGDAEWTLTFDAAAFGDALDRLRAVAATPTERCLVAMTICRNAGPTWSSGFAHGRGEAYVAAFGHLVRQVEEDSDEDENP